MPEEHTFHKVFRQGGTVDNDKILVGTGAIVMDCIGKQLFAGTGFAGNKNVGVAIGCVGHQINACPHLGAIPHNSLSI